MALAPIIYNVETIGEAYAPSLNAAFVELFKASGVKPVVLAPYGGARTSEQQAIISPGQVSSDHVKQRAVDIDNHRTIRNIIGSTKFAAILNKHGWKNVQVNGVAFPTEPWHWANQSSTPQGGGTTPLTDRSNMTTIFRKEGTSPRWALAGDSPGTAANWIETTSQTLASDLVSAHASSVLLTDAQYESFKTRYLAPLNIEDITVPPITIPPITIPSVTVDNTDVIAAINANTAAVKALNPPG